VVDGVGVLGSVVGSVVAGGVVELAGGGVFTILQADITIKQITRTNDSNNLFIFTFLVIELG
jgi:hypothetical protein